MFFQLGFLWPGVVSVQVYIDQVCGEQEEALGLVGRKKDVLVQLLNNTNMK